MEKEKEQPKKCFCARCFLPIEEEDKVDIGGQNFHRMCSTCCVCRTIPKSIKMFYGHVFCADCFKTHVLGQFKGEAPRMHSCSWWSQWAPGMKPKEGCCHKEGCKNCGASAEDSEPGKKYICSRCLQAVDEKLKVDIAGQHFHPQCAKCYFCHCVPTNNLKIYYGQVFCEECFNRHVLNRNRDNPSEFFKTCFEQWQNVQFAENMRQFMGGNKEGTNPPFVFCRCSGGSEWGPQPDTRKSAPPVTVTAANVPPSIPEDESLEDLYFENRTEMSDIPESTADSKMPAAEKIEKLTKYLHEPPETKPGKKWKNFVEFEKMSLASCGWVDFQDESVEASLECPKCLWQCGPIYVPSEMLQKRENVRQ